MISSMVAPWANAPLDVAADARCVEVGARGVDGDGHQLDQLRRQVAAVDGAAHGQELLEPPRVELVDRVPGRVEQAGGLHLSMTGVATVSPARCRLHASRRGLLEQDRQRDGDRVDAEHAHALEGVEDLVAGGPRLERGPDVAPDAGFVAVRADGVEGDADQLDPLDRAARPSSTGCSPSARIARSIRDPTRRMVERGAPGTSFPELVDGRCHDTVLHDPPSFEREHSDSRGCAPLRPARPR